MTSESIALQEFNGHRIATAFHDAGGRDLVVFCHGFKGVKTGPSRYFVRAARLLAERGISSLRFDQYGSGDSEGEFEDSSFDDWVATTRAITQHHLSAGNRVAVFGQSMGGSPLRSRSRRSRRPSPRSSRGRPDANIEPFVPSPTGFIEEDGQLVRDAYWREAHDARIAERFERVACPAYGVFGTADDLVDEAQPKRAHRAGAAAASRRCVRGHGAQCVVGCRGGRDHRTEL